MSTKHTPEQDAMTCGFMGQMKASIDAKRLADAAPELLEALEDCQWGASHMVPSCPQCGNDRASGHKPKCIVGLAIRNAKGE